MKALVLATALDATEIAPTPASTRRGPAIVRTVGAVRTPLNLSVNPFRYDVRQGRIEAVKPACNHRRRVTR
ncbi:MAG: hypothetical protein ACXW2X_08895 [Thermoanaerobaculia bacterium]